jgi:hypothetical protein
VVTLKLVLPTEPSPVALIVTVPSPTPFTNALSLRVVSRVAIAAFDVVHDTWRSSRNCPVLSFSVAVSQIPLPISTELSAGVTFTWVRRARFDADSWVGEIPLGEDSEQYLVDILSGTTVVRTLSATAPTALYAAADEIADFGTAQASLRVRVVQMSTTVGRGLPAESILTV